MRDNLKNQRWVDMRVIIIPSWTPSEKNRIAGVFIYEQAKLLSDLGLNVSIFQIQSESYSIFWKATNRIEKQTYWGVSVYTLNAKTVPKVGSIMINRWASLYDDIYQVFKNENSERPIIHAHGYIAGFAARRLAEKYHIPFVLTEHNSAIIKHNYRWWHESEIKQTYQSAHALIAVSERLKKAMQKLTDQKILVIPNLVNQNTFHPLQKQQSQIFEFIMVGGLDENKRTEQAINAFSIILEKGDQKNYLLRIIGSGSKRQRLENHVSKKQITKWVRFEGILPLDQVAIKMQKADALITISKTETFGKVIIEALASGIPVIASRSADPEEIVRSENGIKIEDDLKQLPKAMIQMTQEADTYIPAKLHKEVIKNYGKEAVLKQVIAVYESVLSSTQKNL
jgi:glycosyltransferase involved in cell wall biosynthesis